MRLTNSALVFLVLLATCGAVGAVDCGLLTVTDENLDEAQACTIVTRLRARAPEPVSLHSGRAIHGPCSARVAQLKPIYTHP
jgi:hypothetical protein